MQIKNTNKSKIKRLTKLVPLVIVQEISDIKLEREDMADNKISNNRRQSVNPGGSKLSMKGRSGNTEQAVKPKTGGNA